jgi:hypothetical protein
VQGLRRRVQETTLILYTLNLKPWNIIFVLSESCLKQLLSCNTVLKYEGGLFEDILLEQGWKLEVLPLFLGSGLPSSPKEFGMVLVLGGPMSANDEEIHSLLKKEISFICQALKVDILLDARIYLDRLHTQARLFFLGYLRLLEKNNGKNYGIIFTNNN